MGGILDREMSFREVMKIVSIIPDSISDGHFKSQYESVKNDRNVDIIKLENIESDFSSLVNKFSLENLDFINKSKDYDYRDYYDEELIEIVKNRYKNDIEKLGYIEEYKELLVYVKNKK